MFFNTQLYNSFVKKNANFFVLSLISYVHSTNVAHGQRFKNEKINFIQAIPKQETLPYPNIFISSYHILYLQSDLDSNKKQSVQP